MLAEDATKESHSHCMYAALDLHEIDPVRPQGRRWKVKRKSRVPKDEERILELLDGAHARVVLNRVTTTARRGRAQGQRDTTQN
jgi:hypothetical protein